MLDYLDNLLNGTGAVSLLKHSAKAVSEHRSDIQEALRIAVGKTEGRCSELVEKVRSIISINIEMRKNTDSHGLDYVLCGRCLVELQADHIKMCSKCHFGKLPFRLCVSISKYPCTCANDLFSRLFTATYCSRDCQVEDWKLGLHKLKCKQITESGGQVGRRSGSRKEAKIADALIQNVSTVGDKIFSTHIDIILEQALLQKYDILDCITVINLCEAPPTVVVMHVSAFLALSKVDRDQDNFEFDQRFVERNRQTGALTLWIKALGYSGPGSNIMKRIAGDHAPFGSWSAAQEAMKRRKHGEVEILYHFPEMLETQLQSLRIARSSFD